MTEAPLPQLTPEYTSQFLTASFRFGQGLPGLQASSISYICGNYRPHWLYSGEMDDVVKIPFREGLEKILLSPNTSGYHATILDGVPLSKQMIVNEARSARSVLHDAIYKNMDSKLQEMLGLVIDRDYYYLVEKGGRPRANPDPTNPDLDPFLSHLLWYGILGNTTGSNEYDLLFKDLVGLVYNNEEGLDSLDKNRLKAIIEVFEPSHSNTRLPHLFKSVISTPPAWT